MESISYLPFYSFVRAIEQLLSSLGWVRNSLAERQECADALFPPFFWGGAGGEVHV